MTDENKPQNSNKKLIISVILTVLGITLLLSSKKTKKDEKPEIKEKNELKPIVINNYIGESKNGKRTTNKPRPKPIPEPENDFTIIEPDDGKNQSDDSGNE